MVSHVALNVSPLAMLPSWFTRLRDVKGASYHKERNKQPVPLASDAKRYNEGPAGFAKSWSLQRANSKAKNARIEADNTTEPHASISDEWTPLGNACNLQPLELIKDVSDSLLLQDCANFNPWGCDFISLSSGKGASRTMSSTELKALMQKGNGVSDNETEDFTLTSETRSSFCSETSSADSSESCKSRAEEKGSQTEGWLEGNYCTKIACTANENLQKCYFAGEENASPDTKVTVEQMSLYCQNSDQVRRETGRRKGSIFSFSLAVQGHRCSVGGNGELRGIGYESNRLETRDVQDCTSWIKKDINISPKSSEREKETSASVENLSAVERNTSKTPDNLSVKGNATAAGANLSLIFDQEDMYRYVSDSVEESSLDPLAHYGWAIKQNEPHSSAETEFVSSNQCTQPESNEDSKRRAFSVRRRQRGASISAVLPPDLQGVVGDSLALVKMSDDPYEDFKQSICEMIMEKDLEGSMDVEELLYCYLTLNAPEHHELIKEVFSDVWSAILMKLR